ncbi:DUF2312 domain-containing protein [Qingshengfaniella alkalisoli]|uniref:DUF2312 domain-containing protein n=1 Tax=Qingshengfaniella alkalisoli TaxID=2599296 RepID=A0A5B8J200_9RHOB|nr:DUF2312 domain-containing protein [Qingshengfaniella alkalisoli]QDY68527.1 DUF2312 domain-containing protein [Qingshengfaniella alkalisoli]
MSVVETDPQSVTGAELRSFVERIERLEVEKKEVAEQIKEVYAELKGRGFDTTAIRAIVRRRKQDPDTIAEQEAVLELYMAALDMR